MVSCDVMQDERWQSGGEVEIRFACLKIKEGATTDEEGTRSHDCSLRSLYRKLERDDPPYNIATPLKQAQSSDLPL